MANGLLQQAVQISGRQPQAKTPFADIGKSLGEFAQKKQKLQLQQQTRKEKLQDQIAFETFKSGLEQKRLEQDPTAQLIKQAKAAEAAKTLGNEQLFNQLRSGGGFGQPQAQPQDVSGGALPQRQFGQFRTEPTAQDQAAQQSLAGPGDLIPGGIKKDAFGRFLPTQAKSVSGIKREAIAKKEVSGLPAESAGKATMLQQATTDLDTVEKLLFPGGKFSRKLAFQSNVPGSNAPLIGGLIPGAVPFNTKAIKINSAMNNALEAKLRIETGAAATEPEFNRLKQRFGIGGTDTEESAKDKLIRLRSFMKNASVKIDPAGLFVYKTGDKELDAQLNTRQAVTPSGVEFTFTPRSK